MVTAALVDESISGGAKLLQALDAEHHDITAALWLYDSEANQWRLVIASPEVDRVGPREFYRTVQRLLAPEIGVSLAQVSVVGPHDRLVELLSSAVAVDSPTGMRFTGNVIDGELIEDALIYRMRRNGQTRHPAGTSGPAKPSA